MLGLSPGIAQERLLRSAVLSPSPHRRRRREKRRRGGAASTPIDVDAGNDDDDHQAPDADDDMLPSFHGGQEEEDVDISEPALGTAQDDLGGAPSAPGALDGELYDAEATVELRGATAAAREGVWSNKHRVTIEEIDEEEEDDDAAMLMDADLPGISEGEDEFWGDNGEEDYDEYEWLYGLPAGDILDEEMERQLAEFGASPLATYIIIN